MKFYPDIHRRRSIRLKEYDYSSPGIYFVTMVCRERESLLESAAARDTLQSVWYSLAKRFHTVELDEFIVMPNHVHGIITIADVRTSNSVGAIHELPLQNNRNRRRNMTLPRIIGYFKMNTAKRINQIHQRRGIPLWQRNYYEHIIRNEDELNRVRQYIRDNPFNWETDEENPNRKAAGVPGGPF